MFPDIKVNVMLVDFKSIASCIDIQLLMIKNFLNGHPLIP